ncbi:NAD(P)/FAD-dependent oxidoreductase [Aeromicrobium fastidiosum]|uniref:NAD(P)/FAD-dependent oxidoreductase n=1 Tax=Aeromicrobium fastidiosum TaxID=52699 RepID=A0A641AMI2_9ACTN|nr:NAD(P)/FAD-dependent oxidoreductase [Aeromicrobium fastidiosum]KAA1378484.1 NAD(P)/FAD-dependent oxidoreductase [Aeromicrobium fastidiosum]MBP2392551.1 thioredoxin reductase [Aeromicrobium fastidiosum]
MDHLTSSTAHATHDVIVIGGGPAGLQAALTLGRMHRSVLMLDSGEYRNATVEHAHNYATHDGIAPAEFRRLARIDLAAYDTVEVRPEPASRVEQDRDDFVIHLEGGTTERAAALVLATGVRDALPDVPGLAEAWGKEIAACPFCHGHELAGRTIALDVDGAHFDRLSAMLGRLGSELVDVHGRVRTIARAGGGLDLAMDDGSIVHVDGMFIAPTFSQSAAFAEQLGLELNESGCVRVNALQATSVPGVFAAGDAAHHPELPMPMSSIVTSQAAGMVAGAAAVHHLLAREATQVG